MAFKNETHALRELLRICKEQGAVTFRVYNGEDKTEHTSDTEKVIEDCNSTGDDVLECYGPGENYLGWFRLIWGNAANGEELPADSLVSPFCDAVWDVWFKQSEEA